MKTVDLETLKDAANRLLFNMSEEQYATLLDEFKTLTVQMGKIGQISGLDEYVPMTFPFACETSFLREDIASEPLKVEDVLKNAGSTLDNQIKLPKVVG